MSSIPHMFCVVQNSTPPCFTFTAFLWMTTCVCCHGRVEEAARLTEEVGQLNASGETSRILVQQHLESILQHEAENQSLEAEVFRLRGIEVCLSIWLVENG